MRNIVKSVYCRRSKPSYWLTYCFILLVESVVFTRRRVPSWLNIHADTMINSVEESSRSRFVWRCFFCVMLEVKSDGDLT